jgi:hypothetical protein
MDDHITDPTNPTEAKRSIIQTLMDDMSFKILNDRSKSMSIQKPSHQVSLSAKGLQNLPINQYDNNFTFVVGDNRYSCPLVLAQFLSPRLCHLHTSDITIRELEIATEDPHGYFSKVLSLGRGEIVSLGDDEKLFVQSIGSEFSNPELSFLSFLTISEDVSMETICSRLHSLSESGSTHSAESEFAASHFYEFSVSDCRNLGFPVLYSILSSPNLILHNEDSLLEIIRELSKDESYFSLLEFVRFEFLSVGLMQSVIEWISTSFELLTFPIWESLSKRLVLSNPPQPSGNRFFGRLAAVGLTPKLDSEIIKEFPDLFVRFRTHLFHLLYRGSRDGFEASAFHRLCDGHSMTLTVILSDNGSIFGGYTPIAWHSSSCYSVDNSLKSFLFTLKNQHNIGARIFPLKEEQKAYAIYGHVSYGVIFGSGHNLCVYSKCNVHNSSYTTAFGQSYTNDTGLPGDTVFTGGSHFRVREIEVFELTT